MARMPHMRMPKAKSAGVRVHGVSKPHVGGGLHISGPKGVMHMPHGPQARPSGHVNMGGKGSTQEHMASRHSRSTITGGDPVQRSLGQYAKGTPDFGAIDTEGM